MRTRKGVVAFPCYDKHPLKGLTVYYRVNPFSFTLKYRNMATFRVVPTGIWADDIFLSMSPEQKMIMLYLHTCPSATQCGIYKLPIKTMGFHLGFTHQPVENALRGLCAAFADLVAYDEQTGEIALLQHPKNVLTNASPKIWKQIIGELQNVQSRLLLQKVMSKNSATANAPYLNRYRQLHIESVNNARECVQVIPDSKAYNMTDNQEVKGEIEKEIEIEKKGNSAANKLSANKAASTDNFCTIFDSFLESVQIEKLTWAPKEAKQAYELSKLISKRLIQKSLPAAPSNVREAFTEFLTAAWETNDKFLRDGFTPSLLVSQFNRIIMRCQQAHKTQTNGKQIISSEDFNAVVARINAGL